MTRHVGPLTFRSNPSTKRWSFGGVVSEFPSEKKTKVTGLVVSLFGRYFLLTTQKRGLRIPNDDAMREQRARLGIPEPKEA